jgi:hypothetical protein
VTRCVTPQEYLARMAKMVTSANRRCQRTGPAAAGLVLLCRNCVCSRGPEERCGGIRLNTAAVLMASFKPHGGGDARHLDCGGAGVSPRYQQTSALRAFKARFITIARARGAFIGCHIARQLLTVLRPAPRLRKYLDPGGHGVVSAKFETPPCRSARLAARFGPPASSAITSSQDNRRETPF